MRTFSVIFAATTLLLLCGARPGGAVEVDHDLQISIDPATHRLSAFDRLEIRPEGADRLVFWLTDSAENLQIDLNGRPVSATVSNSRLQVRLPADLRTKPVQLDIAYTAVFDDPVPVMPVNTDNPGYGVSGTISERGTLLLAGAGWYPHFNANRATYTLRVEAPAGWVAVTAGRNLGIDSPGQKTVSTWRIDHPVRGLALSVARFKVKKKAMGKVSAETYFFSDNSELADAYLAAIMDFIEQYENLFGPYPFPKFAVVENFFPTGYGFPSYTLIGSRVLRLPFIIKTSLGHEIAHCWWGNGVYVDSRQGNWSEALTTYVADYLYQEKRSHIDAANYRRQILRNYASLVSPAQDFPLNRFMSRSDPLTKTIGYDKGAMVFHMLRKKIGDAAFWRTLQQVYRESLFEAVSWRDLQNFFEKQAGESLNDFFDQWVRRSGAPQLAFDRVVRKPAAQGWHVSGRIIQTGSDFNLRGELVLETVAGSNRILLDITGRTTPFKFDRVAEPRRLTFDPDSHLFRRLDPMEIPPTVNSIKGADSLRVILADSIGTDLDTATRTLLLSMGLMDLKVMAESAVNQEMIRENNLLFIGLPKNAGLLARLPDQVRLAPSAFSLNTSRYDDPQDVFFGVIAHPYRDNHVVGLFLPNSSRQADIAARKITHYGKYSYLVFRAGQNAEKGTWPVERSPLMHDFDS